MCNYCADCNHQDCVGLTITEVDTDESEDISNGQCFQ